MSQESQAGRRQWEGWRREWRSEADLLGKEEGFDANYAKKKKKTTSREHPRGWGML